MTDFTRRSAVKAFGAGALAVATIDSAAAAAPQPATSPPAFTGNFQPKPLKFDPGKLDGLSERLIKSHWENNYQGSVKTLNAVRTRLSAALADKDAPPAIYGGLKREELHRTGSVVLHEIYFDGLGGNGQVAGSIKDALGAAFGSYATWEAEFRRTGMSLAGGSGWTILTFNQHTGTLSNHWAWDHMHGAAAGLPLLALDMYEHSFHMDYGTQAAKYIDAWFRNVDWEVVDQRYRRAIGASRA
ncbi:superoxide dismutase [Novosphingobium sp. 9U]|uniref:superoxide dismutase n=1 Tax=Novosphingobium sp. 9U TaxID=2653158 RepID=UPI0012F1CBEB|nr:Fe-Mn family superoxide dismutase [Novosphingobium sp. 9U]VWX54037.1 Superoxide dismutase (Fe) [Novosphingobium sp. 9U]